MGVYGSILRVPGVATVVLATVIGRLPIGITGLAILLYVEEVSGSFASAGICAGALALGSAAGAPFQGRLVDRRGDGVLLPLALIHAGGLLLIWLLGAASAPVALIALASLATGAAFRRSHRCCARAGRTCSRASPGSWRARTPSTP